MVLYCTVLYGRCARLYRVGDRGSSCSGHDAVLSSADSPARRGDSLPGPQRHRRHLHVPQRLLLHQRRHRQNGAVHGGHLVARHTRLRTYVSASYVRVKLPQPHHRSRFTAPFPGPPGEPVLEENFWTLSCKGRLTEADTLTIRLGATPSGLSSAHLHHPPLFTDRMPFLPPNQQCQSTGGN